MTEIGQADATTVNINVQKLSLAVQDAVGLESFRRLTLIFRLFPFDEMVRMVLRNLPSTCHRPVRPGFNSITRRLCQVWYRSYS